MSWIIHATEDEEKVGKKIADFFTINLTDFECNKLEGHFKNPIILCKLRLLGEDADNFVKKLFKNISHKEVDIFKKNIDQYVDEHGHLHIRINKQSFLKKEIRFSETDAMKIKIKIKGFRLSEKISSYRRLLESDT
jgi:RNA binding exosome subunit